MLCVFKDNFINIMRFVFIKFLFISILTILFSIPESVLCNEDFDGQLTFYLSHSLDPGPTIEYTPRGVITVYSLRRGDAAFYQSKPFSSNEIAKLKKAAADGGLYRLRISTKLEDENNSFFTFMKACSLYESSLTDTLILTLDQGGGIIGIAANAAQCIGEHVQDSKLASFNTTVILSSVANGPGPDTQTYIQRLEQEKLEKARGEQGDNRSFLAKYWMYIVPLVIFLLISGASGPDGQGGR